MRRERLPGVHSSAGILPPPARVFLSIPASEEAEGGAARRGPPSDGCLRILHRRGRRAARGGGDGRASRLSTRAATDCETATRSRRHWSTAAATRSRGRDARRRRPLPASQDVRGAQGTARRAQPGQGRGDRRRLRARRAPPARTARPDLGDAAALSAACSQRLEIAANIGAAPACDASALDLEAAAPELPPPRASPPLPKTPRSRWRPGGRSAAAAAAAERAVSPPRPRRRPAPRRSIRHAPADGRQRLQHRRARARLGPHVVVDLATRSGSLPLMVHGSPSVEQGGRAAVEVPAGNQIASSRPRQERQPQVDELVETRPTAGREYLRSRQPLGAAHVERREGGGGRGRAGRTLSMAVDHVIRVYCEQASEPFVVVNGGAGAVGSSPSRIKRWSHEEPDRCATGSKRNYPALVKCCKRACTPYPRPEAPRTSRERTRWSRTSRWAPSGALAFGDLPRPLRPARVDEASGTNRLRFHRCAVTSRGTHLHCAPKMHAAATPTPSQGRQRQRDHGARRVGRERVGRPPRDGAKPLASSYGWRNRYVRIPSAICGSLDCIAG